MWWIGIWMLIAMAGDAVAQTIITALPDVTVGSTRVLIRGVNPNRYALSCTNTSTTVHVRWGDHTVTATRGQQLRAGMAVEITSRGDIYMISESTPVVVSCTEETK